MSSADEATVTEQPEAPVDEAREAMVASLRAELGDAVVDSHLVAGRDAWVRVTRDGWRDAAAAARDVLGCRFFDFLSGFDWMPSPYGRYEDAVIDTGVPPVTASPPYPAGYAGGETRFQVFCHLVDIRVQRGVFLKADLPDDDLRVSSITSLYSGADWHERETWEMYGFQFEGHPGLRHLYLPTEFEGHPLRKDFPLISRLVKPWPGIVDVEPMPGEPEGADEAAAEGADAGDGGDA